MSHNPYSKTEPCFNCPFRRSKAAVRVRPGRAEEIADNMLNPRGGEFICHKYRDMKEKDQVHCAGALIFAEKNDKSTQLMRVAERLGMYDRDELMKSESFDDIFDTREEMVEANRENQRMEKRS